MMSIKWITVALLCTLALLVGAQKSIEHAYKLVSHAVSQVSPELEVIGGIQIAVVILLAILVACWFVGWLVSRTKRGDLLMEWEKRELFGHSPLQVQKVVKKVRSMQPEMVAPAPPKGVQPALAHVAGAGSPV